MRMTVITSMHSLPLKMQYNILRTARTCACVYVSGHAAPSTKGRTTAMITTRTMWNGACSDAILEENDMMRREEGETPTELSFNWIT